MRTDPSSQVKALRLFVERFANEMDRVVADIFLAHHEAIQHIYAIDYQELYLLMNPRLSEKDFSLSEPDRFAHEANRMVAPFVLEHLRMPFVLLDGTYYELAKHFQRIRDDLGLVFDLPLMSEERAIEKFKTWFERDVARESGGDISLSTNLADVYKRAFARLSGYAAGLERLVTLLDQPNCLDIGRFDEAEAISVGRRAYWDVLQALDQLEWRKETDRNNYADALNLSTVIQLNTYFEGEGGQRPSGRGRPVFHLLTHTPALFALTGRFVLSLRYEVDGWFTEILTQPTTLLFRELIEEHYQRTSTGRLIDTLEGLRLKGEQAKGALTRIMSALREGRLSLDVLTRSLLQGEVAERPELLPDFEAVSALLKDPIFFKARTKLLNDEIRQGSLHDFQIASVHDPTTIMRSAHRVANLMLQAEAALQSKNPLLSQVRPRRFTGAERSFSIFSAEHLGLTRQKDYEWNSTFRCEEFELLDATGLLALHLDVYSDFFVVVWPTCASAADFLRAAYSTLKRLGYKAESRRYPQREGIQIIDREGRLWHKPLYKRLSLKRLKLSGEPMLVRVNCKLAAFCWEASSADLAPGRTGVIARYAFVNHLARFHAEAGGTLPEPTFRNELEATKRRRSRR